MKEKWGVYRLDVWGPRDAWAVNERYRVGWIKLAPEVSDKQIIRALRAGGVITQYERRVAEVYWGDVEWIEINNSRTGRPFLELIKEGDS